MQKWGGMYFETGSILPVLSDTTSQDNGLCPILTYLHVFLDAGKLY